MHMAVVPLAVHRHVPSTAPARTLHYNPTAQLSPAAALAVSLFKVPINAALLLDLGAAPHMAAALLRALAVELLGVATCLACHTYLWRECGRGRMRLGQGVRQGRLQGLQQAQG